METKQKVRLLLAALLSLIGVLPATATDYDPSDYLPLAVGNSWTYSHDFYELSVSGNIDDIDRALALFRTYYSAPGTRLPTFTITVRGTEVIDGKTYYVLSDMPDKWPPAPPHFIAGKKLRWEGTRLMERTADGERSVFRFDKPHDASYAIPTNGIAIMDYPAGSIVRSLSPLFYRDGELVTPSVSSNFVDFYQFIFDSPAPKIGEWGCSFVGNYGCLGCGLRIVVEDDYPTLENDVSLLHAVLGGRMVEYEDVLLTPTNTSPSSWGQIKEEAH